jgi:lipocalin
LKNLQCYYLEANLAVPYWILYTDYETAVVWSCTEYLNYLHSEYFWIISRTRVLNDDKIEQLLGFLNDSGINTSYYVQVDQNDCIF